MRLRRFNDKGIGEFRQHLQELRQNPRTPIKIELLESSKLTNAVRPSIEVEEKYFQTKGDAARFLTHLLSPIETSIVEKDVGLWSWLALFFLPSICPIESGVMVVRNDYHYIFEPDNMRHFYRHLLFLPWQIQKLAPEHNRLLLRSSVRIRDAVTTEVMKRLYFTRIPCIFEVLDRLYWDEPNGRPRKGITGAKVQSGDLVHRLPIRIRQLEKTYDLISLNADQLIELLGDEFAFGGQSQGKLFDAQVESATN